VLRWQVTNNMTAHAFVDLFGVLGEDRSLCNRVSASATKRARIFHRCVDCRRLSVAHYKAEARGRKSIERVPVAADIFRAGASRQAGALVRDAV